MPFRFAVEVSLSGVSDLETLDHVQVQIESGEVQLGDSFHCHGAFRPSRFRVRDVRKTPNSTFSDFSGSRRPAPICSRVLADGISTSFILWDRWGKIKIRIGNDYLGADDFFSSNQTQGVAVRATFPDSS